MKLKDVVDNKHATWNTNVSKGKAYKAKGQALDKVDEFFKEQYRRLYDYCAKIMIFN